MNKKRAQVWIETVLYTIVILAIIAIVLSFTIPKINEGKDRMVIEQSISALKNLDKSIYDAARQTGNVRIIEFSLKRGNLYFDPVNEKITLAIKGLSSTYSEPGQTIYDGEVGILSIKNQKLNEINISLQYKGKIDIQYEGKDEIVKINSASLPYKFSIENTGSNINVKEV